MEKEIRNSKVTSYAPDPRTVNCTLPVGLTPGIEPLFRLNHTRTISNTKYSSIIDKYKNTD